MFSGKPLFIFSLFRHHIAIGTLISTSNYIASMKSFVIASVFISLVVVAVDPSTGGTTTNRNATTVLIYLAHCPCELLVSEARYTLINIGYWTLMVIPFVRLVCEA